MEKEAISRGQLMGVGFFVNKFFLNIVNYVFSNEYEHFAEFYADLFFYENYLKMLRCT